MLKKVKTDQAVGMRIAHDMTKIVPGQYKGALFSRGHIVTEADIPELLSMGKEHVYVMDDGEQEGVHEEEAAARIATAIGGPNTKHGQPREGRINVNATVSGLLKINREALRQINSIESVSVATLHSNTPVKSGAMVAATKIVPLYIEDASIRQVEELAGSGQPVIEVKPYIIKKVGVVITGNEVYNGLIKDKFLEVIRAKVESMGGSIIAHRIVPDDEDIIADAVKEMSDKGSELIVTCGGLSVDPDDVTVEGIIRSGAHIISYGTPIMPSAMILLAMLGSTPILGAPAGGLFHTTGIDVLLPRLMAGEIISRQEVIEAGYGGLCLNCARCLYPVCPFAK